MNDVASDCSAKRNTAKPGRSAILNLVLFFTFFCGGCGNGRITQPGFQIVDGEPAFVSIDGGYGVRVKHIPGADAASFKALDSAKGARATYAVDANQAYVGYRGNYMPFGLEDPTTFAVLTKDGSYTSDHNRVYWFGVQLEGADPESFRILKAPYSADSERVYVGIVPMDVHSIDDFEVVKLVGYDPPVQGQSGHALRLEHVEAPVYGWSRDGTAYYWNTTEVVDADYDTLRVLNCLYAKDDSHVFFKGKKMRGADAATFEVAGPGEITGRDRKYKYNLGERTGRVE